MKNAFDYVACCLGDAGAYDSSLSTAMAKMAAQLHSEAGGPRLRSGAEAPRPNTSVAASRQLQVAPCCNSG